MVSSQGFREIIGKLSSRHESKSTKKRKGGKLIKKKKSRRGLRRSSLVRTEKGNPGKGQAGNTPEPKD